MTVGKAELKKIPVLGALGTALRNIFVDRHSQHSKAETLEAIRRRVTDERFPPLLIFPEGTTTNGHCLVQFKKGAFSAGVPVQPVVLKYWSPCLNLGWCGDNSLGLLLWRMMLQPFNCLHMVLLPECVPSDDEQADPILFAKNVRQKIADEMGVSVTEHSYEDLWLSEVIDKESMNIEQTFEARALRDLFGLTFAQLSDMTKKFHAVDPNGTGSIRLAQFCQVLKLPPDKRSEALFHWFDQDDTGDIDFCEFVRGAAMLSDNCSEADRARLAFLVFDRDGDGKVSVDELRAHLAKHVFGEATARGSRLYKRAT